MVTIFTTLKKNLWFGGNNLRRKRKKNCYSYHISATEDCITTKNLILNKARRAEDNFSSARRVIVVAISLLF